ncbi:MAG TPA: L-2-hydroxyglutarate oxidase [Nitrospiraceae bacterium]|nr:L-2-hydroxyglutarate oxidase [Nitrospiraceae bacterium]
MWDFVVVGAWVMGVSIARELRRRYRARVMVIEKEPLPGRHASGRNSGVLHAGVYYKAGTLKARLCVDGNRRMREYCVAKSIPLNENGKVIVARSHHELRSLRELYIRSQANGVCAELVDTSALKEIEPCAKTVEQALYVKDTAVVNPQRVMEALVADSVEEGIEFRFNCAWRAREEQDVANTSQGRIAYGHLVNCAGLYADKIAHQFDVGRQYRILPFRGQFYRLRPDSKVQVRGNIYPVPDLRNPFLGVHFTRRPEGEVTVGPSALPLLGREQYRGMAGANASDGLAMVSYLLRLFGRNQDHFRSVVWRELAKMSRAGFYREAEGLAVGFEPGDLLPGKEPGIRAQLVDTRTAELLNDFVIEPGHRSTHVLNAVSPAFTSSAPFAEHVVSLMNLKD